MKLSYRTVKQYGTDEFVERRSRFIGAVCPVTNEASALEFINTRRKQHWNAKHHVYAYVLEGGQIRRYSDDGEPQGTGGIPVLEVLTKERLTDCVAVVTRYFGGILLGTGGLTRAYSHGARLAVKASGIAEMRLCNIATIVCGYSLYGRVSTLISDQGGIVKDTRYTDHVEIDFTLPQEFLNNLQMKLTEMSAGRLTIQVIGETYEAFSV